MNKKFTEAIYELLRTVPQGKVVTYGDLAKAAGSPGAARAVGLAMKNNPDAPHTPCHRVVAADGSLHGYSGAGGVNRKREMLIAEGVEFYGDRVDLVTARWNLLS
ncbi:MGMT family protein [candidate division WWE3 bacterium]|nr:MGMT family protein [candidate division WWE3 bacterium]